MNSSLATATITTMPDAPNSRLRGVLMAAAALIGGGLRAAAAAPVSGPSASVESTDWAAELDDSPSPETIEASRGGAMMMRLGSSSSVQLRRAVSGGSGGGVDPLASCEGSPRSAAAASCYLGCRPFSPPPRVQSPWAPSAREWKQWGSKWRDDCERSENLEDLPNYVSGDEFGIYRPPISKGKVYDTWRKAEVPVLGFPLLGKNYPREFSVQEIASYLPGVARYYGTDYMENLHRARVDVCVVEDAGQPLSTWLRSARTTPPVSHATFGELRDVMQHHGSPDAAAVEEVNPAACRDVPDTLVRVRLARKIVDTVKTLHEFGIEHGRLGRDSIFLRPEDTEWRQPRISNFMWSIFYRVITGGGWEAEPGSSKGRPPHAADEYTAPELPERGAGGLEMIPFKADIYALGILLKELSNWFPADPASHAAATNKLPDVSVPGLEAAAAMCLSHNPHRRCTAAELLTYLQCVENGLSGGGRVGGRVR